MTRHVHSIMTARFHIADIIRDDLSFLVAVVKKAVWEAVMSMLSLCTDYIQPHFTSDTQQRKANTCNKEL